jgi:hypothetical protein
VEQIYGVKIENEGSGLKAFKNVTSLTAFIAEHQGAS